MSYATVNDLRRILPEKITIGDKNIGSPSPSPGRPGTQRSTISPAEAELYLGYATQQIDSKLRPMYSCPLRRTKSYETDIMDNVTAGADAIVRVRDSGAFMRSTMVRLQDKSKYEDAIIKEIVDLTTLKLVSLHDSFAVFDTKIGLLEYPDPIPLTAARLACAIILDRMFSAEQSPDVSNFGKSALSRASLSMDDIMSGTIMLFGQEHTGYRFARGSLFDAFKNAAENQKGQEKET